MALGGGGNGRQGYLCNICVSVQCCVVLVLYEKGRGVEEAFLRFPPLDSKGVGVSQAKPKKMTSSKDRGKEEGKTVGGEGGQTNEQPRGVRRRVDTQRTHTHALYAAGGNRGSQENQNRESIQKKHSKAHLLSSFSLQVR